MTNRLARAAAFACVTLASILAAVVPAKPQGMSLIRDAEIENTIRAYAAPLLEAAGLGEGAVKLHIVNDPNINAFVAGGPNLFLSSGMLAAAEEPGEIVGVLAHEIGHIAGGHLVRTRDAMENASAEMILATVLAAGAIIAGEGEVGSAVLSGGQAMAQQSFLRYSRAQEEAADQAAVRLLERTGQSAAGLLRMFQRLEERERLSLGDTNSYARTHPLTRERIRFVRDHVARTQGAQDPTPEEARLAHRRMVAKLKGFLDKPEETFRAYPDEDRSMEARYARAIAHYRIPDLQRALAELDAMLTNHPDDPWFHELKGQVLFENGRVREAIAPYSRAVALKEGRRAAAPRPCPRADRDRRYGASRERHREPRSGEPAGAEGAPALVSARHRPWPSGRARSVLPRLCRGRLSARRCPDGAAPRDHRGRRIAPRQRALAQGGGYPHRRRTSPEGAALERNERGFTSNGVEYASAGRLSTPYYKAGRRSTNH